MATLAEQMVAKLESQLLASAGAESVTIDGMSIKYSDLEARYEHWRKRLIAERRTDGFIQSIDQSGAFSQ